MENLDYSAFDRQLRNFVMMAEALESGWDDIMTLEMTIDLKSLCLKASRLCAMADTDYALQQQDLAHLRTQRNKDWDATFNRLLSTTTGPLMKRVVERLRQTGSVEGHSCTLFPCRMSQVLPQLGNMLAEDGMQPDNWNSIMASSAEVELMISEVVRPTVFPGMDYRERFWMLYELFAMQCYLLFHFRRVVALCTKEVTAENAGIRLREVIRFYSETPQGRGELQRYWLALKYDHDDHVDVELLHKEKKCLRQNVPACLQVCFMSHACDLDALALDLISMNVMPEEYLALIDALAKWQMLDEKIQMMLHPEACKPELYNEVFVLVREGKPVDMNELRGRVERMMKLVTRKNHWFCLWCVLCHRGYMANRNYGAFARQMVHRDWFPNMPQAIRFTADSLSDYSGYFTERDFPVWNQSDYIRYRDTHNKRKWGESLCDNFRALCYQMDEAFMNS